MPAGVCVAKKVGARLERGQSTARRSARRPQTPRCCRGGQRAISAPLLETHPQLVPPYRRSSIWRITIETFVKSSEIAARARDVFGWHQAPDALKKLIPPWDRVTIEQPPTSLGNGAIAVLVLHTGPIKQRWVARHRDFLDRGEEGGEFTDEQVSGPFASWVHRHIVRSTGPARCVLEDRIEYAVPLGRVGEVLAGWYVRKKLQKMFDYRHAATIAALRAMGKTHDK